jgi:hypothetical protein
MYLFQKCYWRPVMKRRLIARNKCLISGRFKKITQGLQSPCTIASSVTFASISASKVRGQLAYQKRLARQKRMNSRQLKKYRQKQVLSGLVGSKYDGMCKTELKPAGFLSGNKSGDL